MPTLKEVVESCGARLEVATKRHARDLARIARREDCEESKSAGGFATVEPAIRASMNRSEEAHALYVGQDLLCVFGVVVMPQCQVPWSVSSVHVPRHAKVFWRTSKVIIGHLRGRYPLMMNMIWAEYKEALRWLERLGFTLSPPEKWGVRGDLFQRATMVTERLIAQLGEGGTRVDALKELIHV